MAIVLKRPSAFMASPRDCHHLQLSPRDHLHHLVCRIVINLLCDTHPSTPEEPYHIWYSCASMVNKTTMVHTACASPRPWVSTCLPASEMDPSHPSSLTGQFCGHQPLLQTLHETKSNINSQTDTRFITFAINLSSAVLMPSSPCDPIINQGQFYLASGDRHFWRLVSLLLLLFSEQSQIDYIYI